MIILFLVSPSHIWAQSVPQQSIFPELTGNQLLDSLNANYKPDVVLSYDAARDLLFGDFYYEEGFVACVYTGDFVAINPNSATAPRTQAFENVPTFNTEHVWPQSMGAISGRAQSDMHHLRPIRGDVNTSRSNNPFAIIESENVDTWWKDDISQSNTPAGDLGLWSKTASNPSRFEVRDVEKGNIARMMLYFYTMYKHKADDIDPDYFINQLVTFLTYHDTDPIDQNEYDRSLMIAGYQDGKANPFILDTTLVRRAFFQNYDHEAGFALTTGYIADFESYSSGDKGGYASGTVEISGIDWLLTQTLFGTGDSDKKTGMRSLRTRNDKGVNGLMEMQDYIQDGVSRFSFDYARFGNDSDTPNLIVSYRTDTDTEWTEITTITSMPNDLTTYFTNLDVDAPVRFQFKTDNTGSDGNRINIDNVIAKPFAQEEEGEGPPEIGIVTTSAITGNSFVVESIIHSQGGSFVSDRGFVYSKTTDNNTPEIGGDFVTTLQEGTGIGSFETTVLELPPSTEFTVRSFAINEEGTVYSAPLRFSTLNISNKFVDLYQQSFQDFYALIAPVNSYGAENEWEFTAGETSYGGDWGSGSSGGFRGSTDLDYVFGFQHTGSTGNLEATLTLENTGTDTIEQLIISYTGRSERNTLTRYPEWSVSINSVEVPALHYSTEEGDLVKKTAIINDLSIAPNDEFEISWLSDRGDGSGGSRQIGLSNVEIKKVQTVSTIVTGGAGWRLLNSPFKSLSVSDLAAINLVQGISGANAFYDDGTDHESASSNLFYNQNNSWNSPSDLDFTLNAGQGFIWYLFDNDIGPSVPIDEFDLIAAEAVNQTDVIISLNGTGNFVLTGNPFANNLDVEDVTSWGDIQGGVSVWNTEENRYDVLFGQDAYSSIWQGFWVEKNSDIDPDAELVIPSESAQLQSKNSAQLEQTLSLQLKSDSGYEDSQIHLRFIEEGTEHWDSYDISKIQPLNSSFALLGFVGERNGDSILKSVESRPYHLQEKISIPLEIQSTIENSELRMEWIGLDGIDSNWEILLLDIETGKEINLRNQTSYSFTYDETNIAEVMSASDPLTVYTPVTLQAGIDRESRFELIINPTKTTSSETTSDLPKYVQLDQNYPNPFNPVTTILYQLPATANVRLEVFDILGRRVSQLVDEQKSAGHHTIQFDASDLNSGLYIYRLQTGDFQITKTMMLVK